jgi:transposase InsO family protein
MPASTVLVWRYGARKGVAIPAEAERQLRLAHELREELVAIVHRRERAVEEIWAEHPAVGQAQRDVAHAERARTVLVSAATARASRFLCKRVDLDHMEVAVRPGWY